MSEPTSRRMLIALLAVALAAPALAGCAASGDGEAVLFVKDAPTDEFRHVNITFTKVAIHQGDDNETEDDDAGDQDGPPRTSGAGWITVFQGEKTIDLLAFTESDSRAFLGEANLSAGTYNQIVITVSSASGVQNDGTQVDIQVITGWLRVVRAWQVEAGETTAITIDLDLDRSLVEQGPRGWALTPVVGQVLVDEGFDGERADQPDPGAA